MGLYSEKLMSAVKSLNDPIKTTSTTTAKSNEGLDIGSLLTMLMLSGMFKQPKAETTSSLLATPATASTSTLDKTLGSNAVPALQGLGGTTDVSQLLQILQSLGKLQSFGKAI